MKDILAKSRKILEENGLIALAIKVDENVSLSVTTTEVIISRRENKVYLTHEEANTLKKIL